MSPASRKVDAPTAKAPTAQKGVVMFTMQGRFNSLSDLLSLRVSLRQQQFLLSGALQDVQEELRCWARHRRSREACGKQVPHELCVVWEELTERERELAMDVVQVYSALGEANREIQDRLHSSRPVAS